MFNRPLEAHKSVGHQSEARDYESLIIAEVTLRRIGYPNLALQVQAARRITCKSVVDRELSYLLSDEAQLSAAPRLSDPAVVAAVSDAVASMSAVR